MLLFGKTRAAKIFSKYISSVYVQILDAKWWLVDFKKRCSSSQGFWPFRQNVHSHGSLQRAQFNIFLEFFEHCYQLWFCGLHVRNMAFGIPKKLSVLFILFFFFAPGLLSREDTEDSSVLFNLGWLCWLTTGIYDDEFRIDHIYRSINKCHSFTCLHELRS